MRSANVFAVAVLAVLVLSGAMPASAEINLLENPGFEASSVSIAPWQIEPCCGSPHGGSPHTGDWAALVDATGGSGRIWQEIEPQCAEFLGFWYASDVFQGGLEFGVYYSDGTEDWWDLKRDTDYAWTPVHQDLDAAKLVKAVEVKLINADGRFFVDDFDLEACPAEEAAPVGGVVIPANTLVIVAPWLMFLGLAACTVVMVAKRRK